MHKHSPILTLQSVLFTTLLVSAFQYANGDPPDLARDIIPILDKYCIECHSPPLNKGDLNLKRFDTLDTVRESLLVWKRVKDRTTSRDMPPGKREKPNEEERKLLFTWIDALQPPEMNCERLASDDNKNFYRGYVMSRRLNRLEYRNTVRDLFYGLDLDVVSLFPADGSGGEGFDNNGDTLFSSPILVEHCLRAADQILDAVFGTNGSAPAETKPLRNRILIAYPEGSDEASARQAAVKVVEKFLRRAYRRKIEPDDVFPILALFNVSYRENNDYEAAIRYALKGVLISPHFLFLPEPIPTQSEGIQLLASHPLAARLAYFIWASMPDDELSELADSGALQDPGVLRSQVRRMLADPRARGLAESFAPQWLGLRAFGGSVRPDSTMFSEFDEALEQGMREEPVVFFDDLFRNDRSLLDLIDTRRAFVNERLAAHYGIDGVHGDNLREVEIADANRGGVLGFGAALTVTSHPLRTSPVLRGKWVVEQILGERIPPPPPNVGTLPADGDHPVALTLREQMEQHRRDPECAACHQRMDPIGFGLENFDPIGRWRMEQNGKPIDAAGELASGDKFSSPAELKKIILSRKEQFLRTFSRKMLGYALGRALNEYDTCVIDDSLKNLEANDYHPSALIETIALSYPFRHRYYRD